MTNKKKILAGGLVLLFFFSLIGIRRLSIFRPHSVVLPAISKDIAKGMEKENECYIVRIETDENYDRSGWAYSRWYYMDGTEKRQLMLIGQRPSSELSYVFMEPNRNRFLVKGYVHDELTTYHNMMVFYVEEWHLIEPIKRDYGRDDYRQEQRVFYPRKYLDVYDVEQGDYNPVNTYDLTWNSSEKYYLEQEGYYRIRSRWNENELEWFLIYDHVVGLNSGTATQGEVRYFEDGHIEKKIYTGGNSPEYLLGSTILNNGYDDPYCSDYFIAKGNLEDCEDDIARLEIYKWWIHTPFTDINNLGLKIESKEGFNQSDIENGSYKSYR